MPGAFDGFELAIRAILGQRISVRAATTLAGRLADRFGEPLETPVPRLTRLCPTPEQLAARRADGADLAGHRRAHGRRPSGPSPGPSPHARSTWNPGPDPEAVIGKLQALPGIGDWTAQYIAMRALRWPNAFPAGDLGLLKAWGETSAQQLRQTSEAWRPGVLMRPSTFGKASTSTIRRTKMTDSTCRRRSLFRLREPDRRLIADVGRRRVDRALHVRAQGPASPWAGTELATRRFGVSEWFANN